MSTVRTQAAFAALLLLIPCACGGTSQTASSDPVTAREQQAVGVLKTRYKDVITGTDVHGRTLTVYVDVENMYSMDEQSEADMKAQALAKWRKVWSAEHPRAHATLRLSLRDYYGKEIYSGSARV